MIKIIKVEYKDLEDYIKFIRREDGKIGNISFNEFLKSKSSDETGFIPRADLSRIDFRNNPPLNLQGANLSNTILDNVEFDGNNLFIEGVDFRGASLKNTKFTNFISLDNVNFGNIHLSKEAFVACRMDKAIYKPFFNDFLEVRLTDDLLATYLKEENRNKNLNKFVAEQLGIEDKKVIADLSSLTIDKKFTGCDISGSNISNCEFTGVIKNLQIRDCITHNTVFKNLYLENADLRGTSLHKEIGEASDKNLIMIDEVTFINPKLSLHTGNVEKLQSLNLVARNIISSELGSTINQYDSIPEVCFEGEIELDPCYKANSNDPVPLKDNVINCTREDLENYSEYCLENNKLDLIEPFINWQLKRLNKTAEKGIYADFSNEDLSNLFLVGAKFDNCNFAECNWYGTNLSNAMFSNCNLAAANFSRERAYSERFFSNKNWFGKFINSRFSSNLKKESTIPEIVFRDCNLTGANFGEINTNKLVIENSKAINMQADAIDIKNSMFKSSDFTGSNFAEIQANRFHLHRNNMNYVQFNDGKISNSVLTENDLTKITGNNLKLENCELKQNHFYNAVLRKLQTKGVKIQESRFNALIESAIIRDTNLNTTDIAGLYGDCKDLKNVDFNLAIMSAEIMKLEKEQINIQMEKNRTELIAKKKKYLLAGLAVLTVASFAIPFVLPSVAAVATIAVAAQVALTVVTTSAFFAAGVDHYCSKWGYHGVAEWAVKKVFNIEKELEKINAPLQNKLDELDKGFSVAYEKIKLMPLKEKNIIENCKQRWKNEANNDKNKSKFQDNVKHSREEKNITRAI
jgi:fluoroquinolone resistance protein